MFKQNSRVCFPQICGLDYVFNQNNVRENIPFSFELPEDASCSMVICGDVNSDKSRFAAMLAAHMKVMGGEQENSSILYYSLSEDRRFIAELFRSIGSQFVVPFDCPPFDKSKLLEYYAGQQGHPAKRNCVFMPRLTPLRDENFAVPACFEDSDFMRRKEQIRQHISQYKALEQKKQLPPLRLLIIDSVNMFSDITLKRYMVEQLFELCRDNGLMGIFTVDTTPPRAQGQFTDLSIIRHAADMVIDLNHIYHDGFSERRLSVVKSRISENITGELQMRMDKNSLEVFPSLCFWLDNLMKNSQESIAAGGTPKFFNPGKRMPVKNLFFSDTYNKTSVLLTGNFLYSKIQLAFLGVCEHLKRDCNSKDAANKFMLVSFGGEKGCFSFEEEASGESGAYYYGLAPHGKTEEIKYTGTLTDIKIQSASNKKNLSYDGFKYWIAPGNIRAAEFIMRLEQCFRKLKRENISIVMFHDIGYIQSQYPLLYRDIVKNQGLFFRTLQSLLKQWEMNAIFVNTEWRDDPPVINFNDMLIPFMTRVIRIDSACGEGAAKLKMSGKDTMSSLDMEIKLNSL